MKDLGTWYEYVKEAAQRAVFQSLPSLEHDDNKGNDSEEELTETVEEESEEEEYDD